MKIFFFQKCFSKFPQPIEKQKCYLKHKSWKRFYVAWWKPQNETLTMQINAASSCENEPTDF